MPRKSSFRRLLGRFTKKSARSPSGHGRQSRLTKKTRLQSAIGGGALRSLRRPTIESLDKREMLSAAPVDDVFVIGGMGLSTVVAAQGLLGNGTSGAGQALTVAAGPSAGVKGGNFQINADGSFTYAPGSSFPGWDRTTCTLTDTATGETVEAPVTVLTQAGGVAWKFYESVLDRAPDDGGLTYWISDFKNGGQTGDISVKFFQSPELLTKIIDGYYEQYLFRAADDAGISHWEQVWDQNGGPEVVQAGFAASQEFTNSAGGTVSGWLTAMYERVLDRQPEPNGMQYWTNQLQAMGGLDIPNENQVALRILQSEERFSLDVANWFNEYLQRQPTSAETHAYVSQMLAGTNDRDIEKEITSTTEYSQNPPAPAAGTGYALASYYIQAGQQPAPPAPSPQPPASTISVDGVSVANAVITTTTNGITLTGNATLPLVGNVHVTGNGPDEAHVVLTAPAGSVDVGGITLSNATATVNGDGMILEGDLSLPLAPSIHLKGSVQDSTHYSLGAQSVTIGSFLKADVAATFDSASGSSTLSFNNVAINLGSFAGNFLGTLVHDLQTATKDLLPVAQTLVAPLPGLSRDSELGQILGQGDISPIRLFELLSQFLNHPEYAVDASYVQSFAEAIVELNNPNLAPSSQRDWINLGSFTASAAPSGGAWEHVVPRVDDPAGVSWALNAIGGVDQLHQLGVQFPVLDDPSNFFKIIAGDPTVNLVTWTLSVPQFDPASVDVPLASFPMPGIPVVNITGELTAGLGLQGSATFAFDTSGLQSGDLSKGFKVHDASLSATASIGLAGEIDLGDGLLKAFGYKVNCAENYTATVSLAGDAVQVSTTGPTPAITVEKVGPSLSFPWNLDPNSPVNRNNPFFGADLNPLFWLTVFEAKELARGLENVGVPVDEIADALHTAVSHDLGEVTNYLSSAVDDIGQVANAVWGRVTNDLPRLADALVNHWGGANHPLSDVAGALSGLASTDPVQNLQQVVGALSTVDGNLTDVAKAVWNHLTVGFQATDLATALSAVASTDPVTNLQQVVSALSAIDGNLANVATDVWGHLTVGFQATDLATALSAVASTDPVTNLQQVVSALSAIDGNPANVAADVWGNLTVGINSNDLAYALVQTFGIDLTQALLDVSSL